MARPKKSESSRRTRQFTVRFTEDAAAAVEAAASQAQMRTAEWLNRAAVAAAEAQPAPRVPSFSENLTSSGDGQVVGLLVLDEEKRPHLLTAAPGDSGAAYPCILRWDAGSGRWVNTSDERTGKETARQLMKQLGIDEGEAEITHHYLFRVIRKAWNRFEDVLYDRIRK